MPLEDILPALKTINSGITGVTTAFDHDDMPESIHTADLPAVFVYPLNSPIDYSAAHKAHLEHVILMDCIVSPRSRAPLAQQMSVAVPFVDLFVTTYAAAMKLNELETSTAEDDEYIARLQEYTVGLIEFEQDVFYIGIQFTLQVDEHICKTTGT